MKDGEILSKKDLIIGTVIALVMGTIFAFLSSGMSLIVTFIPGLIFTWLTFVWLYAKKIELPDGSEFLPIFFALLAVQFLHFAEEFITGFRINFPVLYGGTEYSEGLFVVFNMLSYFIFTVACIFVFTKGIRFLLIPVLFFIIYGAIGNAVSHTWWSIYLQSYFPGFFTAQIYWILGPMTLYNLLGKQKNGFIITGIFAGILILLLTIFALPLR